MSERPDKFRLRQAFPNMAGEVGIASTGGTPCYVVHYASAIEATLDRLQFARDQAAIQSGRIHAYYMMSGGQARGMWSHEEVEDRVSFLGFKYPSGKEVREAVLEVFARRVAKNGCRGRHPTRVP
jgi:hypothetical protein